MTKKATKVCTECGEEKPITDFWLCRKGLPWRRGKCKKCSVQDHTDYINRRIAAWKAANGED